MFWNVIDHARQSVLKQILESPPVPDCYLAGGTALALLLGHRESIDFDWFTSDHFSPDQIENTLAGQGNLLVTEAKPGTFHGIFEGVQVTWLHYASPLLESVITSIEIPGLRIASLTDIGTMKLIAASAGPEKISSIYTNSSATASRLYPCCNVCRASFHSARSTTITLSKAWFISTMQNKSLCPGCFGRLNGKR